MEERMYEFSLEKLMHELPNITGRIADQLGKFRKPLGNGIHPDQIPDIIKESIGTLIGSEENHFNCYPGIPGGRRCSVAFFVSLANSENTRGRGHLNCRKALEKIVQHMQGSCSERTSLAVLITDSWDPEAFEEWKANLHEIDRQKYLRILLILGGTVSPIDIEMG